MPFDGTGSGEKSRQLEQLDRIAEILDAENRWCKGMLVTQDGRRCLLGAIIEARAETLKPAVLTAIREVTGRRYSRIEKFNDARGTTYSVLLSVIEQARHDISLGVSGATLKISAWEQLRRRRWFRDTLAGWTSRT